MTPSLKITESEFKQPMLSMNLQINADVLNQTMWEKSIEVLY